MTILCCYQGNRAVQPDCYETIGRLLSLPIQTLIGNDYYIVQQNNISKRPEHSLLSRILSLAILILAAPIVIPASLIGLGLILISPSHQICRKIQDVASRVIIDPSSGGKKTELLSKTQHIDVSSETSQIRLKTLYGKDIIPFASDLARISNVVYKEYPYLYDVEDDAQFYLTLYCHTPEAKLCLAYEGENIIGYVIGVPLKDYSKSFQTPFIKQGLEIDRFFYIGEFALLPTYRKQGIGKRMLLQIEELVKKERKYSEICLAHIDESRILSKKPHNYRSLSTFWNRFGYEHHANLSFILEWKNVGEKDDSPHTLTYWIKKIPE